MVARLLFHHRAEPLVVDLFVRAVGYDFIQGFLQSGLEFVVALLESKAVIVF